MQNFAYCVQNNAGLKIETMRYSKRESIKAYMQLTFPDSDMAWKDLTKSNLRCVKVELKCLTQNI